MEKKITYSAFQAIKPQFNALARVGYFKIVMKTLSPAQRALHKYYRIFIWVTVGLYNVQHILRVIKAQLLLCELLIKQYLAKDNKETFVHNKLHCVLVHHNTDKIVDTLFILLTTLSTFGKQLAFNLRSRRIDNMINIISGTTFAPKNRYHVEVMKENALMMSRLLQTYLLSVIICTSMWGVFPLVNRSMGLEVEFTGYFPFDTNIPLTFGIVLAYMSIWITIQGVANASMDCTIVSFYAQARVQLQMLRHDLENFGDLSEDGHQIDASNKQNGVKVYEDKGEERIKYDLQKRLISNVLHHQKIIWFVNETESIFAEAMLFQFSVTAWVICMTTYKIIGLSLFSAEFISMVLYLLCMMVQLFLYCYYGTQVKYESEFVNQSIYFGGWLSLSPRLRRQLLLMMTNYTRPITPRTAYVVHISLETYLMVLRASYTLFTFLKRK